ncbi:Hypothetical protein GLP15_4754 [Giardia lamblia P15]|uniref:C2H2-type domain-containing protein n=1 Tax=Giardia intestinalis (strain P15) TaxID=658858 RepID=E1F4H1_GIAIA|nr:Hypothetical protein GLP15_4754 [Giardia lamblia P15]
MEPFSTIDFTPTSEFTFQRTTGLFNERQVMELNPDYMDIDRLNTSLSSLVYGDIGTFVCNRNTPNWAVKLCQVQQYFAQYLLYTTSQCEAYLRELVTPQTDPNLAISLQQEIEKLKAEIKRIQQKHETENMMYKLMSVRPEVVEALPTCLHCGKMFGAYEFLLAHHKRRHPGYPDPKPPVPSFAPLPHPCQCCIHEDEPAKPVPAGPVTIEVGLNPASEQPSSLVTVAPLPQESLLPQYVESDIFAEGGELKTPPSSQGYVSFDSHMSEYYHNLQKRVHLQNTAIDNKYKELKQQYTTGVSSTSTSIF